MVDARPGGWNKAPSPRSGFLGALLFWRKFDLAIEGSGDPGQYVYADIELAAFYPGHMRALNAGGVGNLLLGQAAFITDLSNPLAYLDAIILKLLFGHVYKFKKAGRKYAPP